MHDTYYMSIYNTHMCIYTYIHFHNTSRTNILVIEVSSHQDLWRARLGSDGGALWEQLTAEGEA